MNLQQKQTFLNNISSSTIKYKRVSTSPIRYAGGKSLGVGHIIELLPDNINKVISPFFGGGSVEIAMSKFLDIEVIGYDIFDILVNYWNIQINNKELLYKKLKKLEPTQETYDEIKNKLEDHWDKTTKTFESWSNAAKCNISWADLSGANLSRAYRPENPPTGYKINAELRLEKI